uniref:Protein NLRC3 n=1 Tax=Cajanus cajan TaxID=3821 RepID=A0A151S517_CAJCA|nr:Protein NLRC3 [Cajanus cajan]
MAPNQTLKELQWALQAIKSESLNLHSISFYLSQPTSGCYQETDNSITINISKENLAFFSHLLTTLAAPKSPESALRNLEFHRVEWDSQQVRNLGALLGNSQNIQQVVFRRNKFNGKGLSELADILKANKVIKEIMVSESGIGSVGAGLIASALRVNDSLEELQIWEDSIGSRGAEELSKMIEVNSTLKLLTIFDSNSITATPLISAVLARNRKMEVHVWSGENGGEKSSKVVEFVPENSTLRIYKLNLSGTCRVTCSLGMNFIVKSLDLTGVKLKSRCAKEFRWVLEQNQTLKEVNLSRTCLKDKGIVYVAAGLFKNRSLQTLHLTGNWFSGIGVEHLLCPLSRFSALQMQANTTLTCVTFGGGRTRIGRDGLAAVIQFLITNETTLLQTIMETLQINPWIEDIDLSRTPLHNSGKTQGIYQRLGQHEKTEPEMDLLKDMPLTEPKSCRVFFCGQECAGKTTLCHSISQNFSASALPYLDHVKTIVNPVEQAVKAVGMKIKTFKDEDTRISIWNLAGQHEFFSLHDLMFPGHGSASFFIIISSLFRKPSNKEPKTSSEIEEDLQYWLRFIVSNSKRAIQQCMLPSVAVVLTHFDKINQPSENLQHRDSIQRLRDKFQGFVDFYPTVFTVDARSTASVSKLSHHIRKTSKTILQRVPRVYQLCNDLIQILSDWRTENYNKPAMKWKEFGELCQVKVPPLRIQSRHVNKEKVEMRRRAVATCLHHIGEVIYFDELGFLILDCEWFCGEALGQLIKLNVRKQHSSENNGFISRKELEKILRGSLQSPIPGIGSKVFENLDASDLVRMMLKLELCYEQDPSDPNSLLLIPSILEEGRGKPQKWQLSMSDCVYAGRHLECDDSSHMFLTPGFFPRLQPFFPIFSCNFFFLKLSPAHNNISRIKALKDQHGATYSLEKYLISISINGIYIRVELGGQPILQDGFDFARDLLSDDDFREVLHRRLLLELHRKVNHLATFNVQVEERKVPNMIYFVKTENYTRRLVTTVLSGMNALRLHMLCEFRGQMHVVEDQMGCEIMQVDNVAVKSLAPYMKKFMTLVTLALKIGAHLAAGMGQLIPDLSKEVAHLAGSSVLFGAAGATAAGVVGAAALNRRNRSMEGSRDIQQDLRAAQQWVVDFLRERRCSSGKDIAEKFGLWRVRYRDNGQIAWICRRHIHARSAEIIEVPV